jgi:hypothetical protein
MKLASKIKRIISLLMTNMLLKFGFKKRTQSSASLITAKNNN